MCGLVGAVSTVLNDKDKKVFQQLLFADTFRGPHSTGVFYVPTHHARTQRKETALYHKRAVDGPRLMKDKAYGKVLKPTASVLSGHNRYATMGEVVDKNAHPFLDRHILGCHNGTLDNQSLLPDHREYAVDSENLVHSIAEQGIEETWKVLDGAAALMWWDISDSSINFARNRERPLHYVIVNGNTLYWASEEDMLYWIVHRNHRTGSVGDIQSFGVNTHYKIDLSSSTGAFADRMSKKPLTAYEAPIRKWAYSQSPYRSPNSKDGNNLVGKEFHFLIGAETENDWELLPLDLKMPEGSFLRVSKASWSNYQFNNERIEVDVNNQEIFKGRVGTYMVSNNNKGFRVHGNSITCLGDPEFLEGYRGRLLSLDEWELLSASNCSDCGAELETHDHKDIHFWAEDSAMCPDCVRNLEHMTGMSLVDMENMVQ